MVNGCKIVDTTLGEAKKILHKASTDQKVKFLFACNLINCYFGISAHNSSNKL